MKVLWITGNYYPQVGGLQVYIDRITASLAQYAEVALLTEAWQQAPENQHIAHFKVANLTRPASVEQWEEAADGITQAIEAFQPDIVHFSNANVAVYRPIVPDGIKTVATVHGNDLTSPWQSTPKRDVMQRIVEGLRACDHLFAVSNHSQSLVERWGVDVPCTVITSGCDTEFFRPIRTRSRATRRKYEVPDGVPMILTVARLVPRKGHSNVLEALARLPFETHWVVVGDGPMREAVIYAVEESGMAERIFLAGEVSKEDLLALYNACDIFVLTPEEREFGGRVDSEGFGLVFHEAGASRKPVITSAVSGCQEAVIPGITGLLVPPDDPDALAAAIDRVLREPGLGDALARGGLALVRMLGGWERVAQQTVAIYEQVLAPSTPSQPAGAIAASGKLTMADAAAFGQIQIIT